MRLPRSRIVAAARSWIGTPYHHQASCKHVGCDCLGLVRGVWRELYGDEPQALPAYTHDWGEVGGEETLLEAARHHLVDIDASRPRPGDVLVFRLKPRAIAKHAAIAATPDTMVHAQENVQVCEVHLGRWWARRIAGIFCFPGMVD